jgi:hypothetical protein
MRTNHFFEQLLHLEQSQNTHLSANSEVYWGPSTPSNLSFSNIGQELLRRTRSGVSQAGVSIKIVSLFKKVQSLPCQSSIYCLKNEQTIFA